MIHMQYRENPVENLPEGAIIGTAEFHSHQEVSLFEQLVRQHQKALTDRLAKHDRAAAGQLTAAEVERTTEQLTQIDTWLTELTGVAEHDPYCDDAQCRTCFPQAALAEDGDLLYVVGVTQQLGLETSNRVGQLAKLVELHEGRLTEVRQAESGDAVRIRQLQSALTEIRQRLEAVEANTWHVPERLKTLEARQDQLSDALRKVVEALSDLWEAEDRADVIRDAAKRVAHWLPEDGLHEHDGLQPHSHEVRPDHDGVLPRA